MSDLSFVFILFATAMALVSLGGGLYEYSVVDPFWPRKPELVQPARGGISRRRFWIPAHVAYELALIVSLVLAWKHSEARTWLLVALASYATMRIWSALDFIPKSLAFERAEAVSESAARAWTRRSLWRLPLDLVTCGAMLAAFAAAVR